MSSSAACLQRLGAYLDTSPDLTESRGQPHPHRSRYKMTRMDWSKAKRQRPESDAERKRRLRQEGDAVMARSPAHPVSYVRWPIRGPVRWPKSPSGTRPLTFANRAEADKAGFDWIGRPSSN